MNSVSMSVPYVDRAPRTPAGNFARIAHAAFVAKGALYLALAGLALRVDLARPSAATHIVIGSVGIGLILAAVYKFVEAFARPDPTGHGVDTLVMRFVRLVTAAIYALLAVGTLRRVTLGVEPDVHWSARLLEHPYGPELVTTFGLFVVGFGCQQLYRAYAHDCARHLDVGRMHRVTRRLVGPLTTLAYAGRGVAFGLLGVVVINAATHFDPRLTPRGVAGALESLPTTVAVLIAAGMAAYAMFCLFILARYFVPRS